MGYRKDIQILRGIAVLLVVLFHLDVAGFKSGFLGVDVFFVISGYLMACMYDPLKKAEFFAKRARRLLPAYFAVVIVTLIAAIGITTPNDYEQVSNQALFATFFASNIGFWMENSYFDKAAFKPLLHLWSIAVEIQFYLLLPLLYGIFNRVKFCFPLILAASALSCFVVVGISPKTSFFWLPFRLWEFLIGFGVARYCYRPMDEKRSGLLAWIGAAALLAIICIPFIHVDGEALGIRQGHPGLFALFISLATAAALWFGIPKKIEANPIAGLLEKTGTYSYSIYLAHFPVIVLFLYRPFAGTVVKAANFADTAILAVLVIFASAILFQFVEQPFRANKQALRWTWGMAFSVMGVSQVGMLAQSAFIPKNEMLIYQAWFDRAEYRCGKIKRIIDPGAISCEITHPIESPSHRVLLVGNSHADSIKTTFSAVAQDRNVSVYFMVENNPLMPSGITPEGLVKEALAKKIDAIVLHYAPGSVDYHVVGQLAGLAKKNSIRLAFIMPVPVWDKHVPTMLLKKMKGAEAIPQKNINDYEKLNGALINNITKIDYDKFKVYQVADVFCKSSCALTSESGKPLYFDGGHLTLTGSEKLRMVFNRVLDDLS